MPNVWLGIYLGTGPIIDPTEGNQVAENAGLLVGMTFGSSGNTLVNRITEITAFDSNGNGYLEQNNNIANETFTADIGSGLQTFIYDAGGLFNVTVTFIDGSTANVQVPIFQATTGELFLAPSASPAVNATLTSAPIRSITITSVQNATFAGMTANRADLNFPTCFVADTPIPTPDGMRPAVLLRPGDPVITRDSGVQPVRWVGRKQVPGFGVFAPMRFLPGAFGEHGLLEFSPQHRVAIGGWRVELLFGQTEVLVAAVHLVDGRRVVRAPRPVVTYVHLMFDRHELIDLGGLVAESFHPGDTALAADPAMTAELFALFPELRQPDHRPATARQVLRRHETMLLDA
ncbi:MAG: Hint domain-containing protein [Gemmobacter sp.]